MIRLSRQGSGIQEMESRSHSMINVSTVVSPFNNYLLRVSYITGPTLVGMDRVVNEPG